MLETRFQGQAGQLVGRAGNEQKSLNNFVSENNG
jgi:hypothetical protein